MQIRAILPLEPAGDLLLLHQLPGLCPFWLLQLPKGHMVWYPAWRCTHNIPKQARPRGLFIAFLSLLPFQTWDQNPTSPYK